jgi:hypothetical protein
LFISAARDLDQVDAGLVQSTTDGLRIIEAEPAALKSREVELDRYEEIEAYHGPSFYAL